jgi:hypothetical protein
MKNMTIGDIKPKDEEDDDQSTLFQVLPSSYTSHKDQVVMWKGMKNQFINRLIILHLSLLKMQVLNQRFIMPLQKIILLIKLLVT